MNKMIFWGMLPVFGIGIAFGMLFEALRVGFKAGIDIVDWAREP